jgi:hypothetical protein
VFLILERAWAKRSKYLKKMTRIIWVVISILTQIPLWIRKLCSLKRDQKSNQDPHQIFIHKNKSPLETLIWHQLNKNLKHNT